MATTLETYAPFDSGAGSNVTEDVWRKFMKNNQGGSGVLRGVLNAFWTFGDSTGMQIKIQSGECWIQGHWGTKTTETTLSIAAAHATLARKDRAILRADFTNNRIELDVLTGTAAGSPTAPTLTQNTSMWETSLAVVDVPAAASTITSGNVTLDTHYTGCFAKYRRANGTTQSLATASPQKNTYPTPLVVCADVVASGTNNTDFSLMRAGEWTITFGTMLELANQTGSRLCLVALASDINTRYVVQLPPVDPNGLVITSASVTERFSAGTALSVYSYQTSGASGTVSSADNLSPTFVSFRWNGW